MRTLLIAILFTLFVANAYAANDAVTTFGDWAKQCESVPVNPEAKDGKGKKEQVCFIYQTVSSKKTKETIMQVRIGFPPKSNEPVMIVTLPLGVLLPPGAAFMVGSAKPVDMPFLACGREGCTTLGQKLDSNVLNAMRKGTDGSIRVALLNKKVLPIPVSLKGFTRAYNAIAPK